MQCLPCSASMTRWSHRHKSHGPLNFFPTVRQHFKERMPVDLARECEGDEKDVAANDDDDDNACAMEGLQMEDGEDEATAGAAAIPTKKKKKKKKKAKKME